MGAKKWFRIDPDTGEILDELVEPAGEVPPERRLRRRRHPMRAPHAGRVEPRRAKPGRLRRQVFNDLVRRVYDPPVGFSRAEVRGPNRSGWRIAGDCISPRPIRFWNEGSSMEKVLEVSARCRRCAPCRSARARVWSARARRELLFSQQTKFVTLTLNDNAMAWLRAKAVSAYLASDAPEVRSWRVRAGDRASGFADRPEMVPVSAPEEEGDEVIAFPYDRPLSWDELSDEQQFVRLEQELFEVFRHYAVRVRKALSETHPGVRLRYLLVAERSSSGKRGSGHLHYHMLVHQHGGVVPRELLKREWRFQRYPARSGWTARWERLGFVRPRVVDDLEKALDYTLKTLPAYMTKETGMRIRASRYYGEPWKGVVLASPGGQGCLTTSTRSTATPGGELGLVETESMPLRGDTIEPSEGCERTGSA